VIAWHVNCSVRTVERWQERNSETLNLADAARSGRHRFYKEESTLHLIAFYCQSRPLNGKGQWTLRWAETHLQLNPEAIGASPSKSSIQRILNRHDLHPHLMKYFLHVTDPDFFPKMEHLIQTYKTAGDYLFCFDECPGIQILNRLSPDMRSSNSSHNLEESFYSRRGTVDVLAFLKVSTGTVVAHCETNHKGETFRRLFEEHVALQPTDVKLHYIMDNLSSHASDDFCKAIAKLSDVDYTPSKNTTAQDRRDWLGRTDKRIVIHFTPFHGSWLNMVEIWFSIFRTKCLKGSFESENSIRETIKQFIEIWNLQLAKPFQWKYTGEGLHQKVVERVIAFLSYHHTEMELGFLTKNMRLITNVAKQYSKEVSHQTWLQIGKIVEARKEYIEKIVSEEKKPKVKKNAIEALKLLLETMRDLIESIQYLKVA
jgi:transposase